MVQKICGMRGLDGVEGGCLPFQAYEKKAQAALQAGEKEYNYY